MHRLILSVVLICVFAKPCQAETMRQLHDNFQECMKILDSETHRLDAMLQKLQESNMSINPNGWIANNIVEAAQIRINLAIYNWHNKFYFRKEANPEICRRQVEQLVKYVDIETQKILQLH